MLAAFGVLREFFAANSGRLRAHLPASQFTASRTAARRDSHMNNTLRLVRLCPWALLVLLTACGGGGSDAPAPPAPPPPPAVNWDQVVWDQSNWQ
jgi:hypothetical protein